MIINVYIVTPQKFSYAELMYVFVVIRLFEVVIRTYNRALSA